MKREFPALSVCPRASLLFSRSFGAFVGRIYNASEEMGGERGSLRGPCLEPTGFVNERTRASFFAARKKDVAEFDFFFLT